MQRGRSDVNQFKKKSRWFRPPVWKKILPKEVGAYWWRPPQPADVQLVITRSVGGRVYADDYDYYRANIKDIEAWFNVITPKTGGLLLLRKQLAELSKKNWSGIIGL
jgi:hypothetical protein